MGSFIGGDALDPQDTFIQNKTSIMVATKAFGMGIDKPNIRFTVNVNHSGSPEAFVQEAGRAGRDRKMALAVILYSGLIDKDTQCSFDFEVHRFFYNNNFFGKQTEKIVLYYIIKYITIWCNDTSASIDGVPGVEIKGLLSNLNSIPDNCEEIFYISYKSEYDFHKMNELLKQNNERPISFNDYESAILKAIYRMCCIGIIKDYTREYSKNMLRIVIKKLPPNGYYDALTDLLKRYYGEKRAYEEAKKAKNYKGNNEIQKCLGFLNDFIYDKIAGKRWQAILDIEELCRYAVDNQDWLESNEQIKDYLYYYFNSKFARDKYIAPNGENFSLTEDTERGKISSFKIVKKYLRVIDDEICADGSPKDNIKHLQGAVRLIRRALMEPNPSLNLLNIFCILYLNEVPNEHQQKEIESNYIECVSILYKTSMDVNACNKNVQEFLNELGPNRRSIIDKEAIARFENLTYSTIAYHHVLKIQNIFNKFLKK